MSGIMAAVAGNSQNIVYTAGLYGPAGVDQSPIDDSDSNNPTPFTRDWIGYYRPVSTGSVLFGLQTLWSSGDNIGQYSQGYVWVGNTAKSGYNSGNALLTSDDNYATGSVSLVAGQYYPIRIRWSAYLRDPGVFYNTNGSMAFYVNSSTTLGSTIFYNSLTNGF
jgi:hypothetical protein